METSPYTSSAPRSTRAPNETICLTLTRRSEPGTNRRSTSSCVRVGSGSNVGMPCNRWALRRRGRTSAEVVSAQRTTRASGGGENAPALCRPAAPGYTAARADERGGADETRSRCGAGASRHRTPNTSGTASGARGPSPPERHPPRPLARRPSTAHRKRRARTCRRTPAARGRTRGAAV